MAFTWTYPATTGAKASKPLFDEMKSKTDTLYTRLNRTPYAWSTRMTTTVANQTFIYTSLVTELRTALNNISDMHCGTNYLSYTPSRDVTVGAGNSATNASHHTTNNADNVVACSDNSTHNLDNATNKNSVHLSNCSDNASNCGTNNTTQNGTV